MRNIIFIMLPYPSHYNNTFSYANAWKSKGYNVIYAGLAAQKDLVQKQGFEFYEILYSVEYQIKSFKSFTGLLIKSFFDEKDVEERFAIWQMSISSAIELVENHSPYAVFIDAHLTYLYFYLASYTNNIAILNTKLSTQRATGIPPLNSSYIPSKTVFSKLYCEFLWIIHLSKRRVQEYIKSIAYKGKDRNHFLYSWAKEKGIYDLIDRNNGLFNSIRQIPRIILGLELLEFEHRLVFKNEYYVNLPIKREESAMMSEEYIDIRQKILFLKKHRESIIIYVSFGTIGKNNIDSIITFLNKLFRIAESKPQWFFVISLVGINTKVQQNANVRIFSFVPQLDFLKYTDVMITHGGMGSIKECIQAGVPMLVYPLDKSMDQPGNGARVQAKGLGLRGDIDKDSFQSIERKIGQVIEMKYEPIISSENAIIDIF